MLVPDVSIEKPYRTDAHQLELCLRHHRSAKDIF
jgi:hypothetical protein